MDFALVAFGLGVGILVGMTGIGGGSLMTPMLILVFGVTPVTAIGTDLAYAAVTKTVGGYKHLTQKTVNITLSSWMAIGSVPAAVCGVYVLGLLEDWAGRDFEDIVIAALACALLLTGAATVRTTLAVVLLGAGLALLIKAGLGIPIEVLGPFPLGVVVLLVVTMLRSRKARAEAGT